MRFAWFAKCMDLWNLTTFQDVIPRCHHGSFSRAIYVNSLLLLLSGSNSNVDFSPHSRLISSLFKLHTSKTIQYWFFLCKRGLISSTMFLRFILYVLFCVSIVLSLSLMNMHIWVSYICGYQRTEGSVLFYIYI